jgi:hypothetical protein
MIGMIELAQDADASFWVVVEEFAIEMTVRLAFRVLGAAACSRFCDSRSRTPVSTRCWTLAAAG